MLLNSFEVEVMKKEQIFVFLTIALSPINLFNYCTHVFLR